jgi:predicted phage terminase large subunit-like protein
MAMSAVDKKREMLRTLARKDILWFGQYMQPKFKMYAHQKLIAEKLKRIVEYIETRGQSGCGRLMVLMPPQHGKSTISANLFPAWALGNHPDWRFVMVSYNAKRAERNSKAVRDLVDSVMFSPLFGLGSGQEHPVELSSDNRGVSSWSLAQPNTGGMISAGVGGSITGYDAQVIIVDDPFAGREDAESAAEREKVIDWYESQVYSRQQDGTAIILFHTRWHQADLAGHLISSMANNPKADQWEIICLPALAFEDNEYPRDVEAQARLMLDGVYLPLADPLKRLPGAALCPEMTRLELLENIRENMNAYNWMSLYQQMPFLRSGGMFKRQWFQVADEIAAEIKFARALWYWDQAASGGSGDYSAGVLMAVDQFGRVWVLLVVHGQFSTFERRREMRKAWEAARLRFGERLPVAQLWHQQDPAGAGLDSARDTNVALAGLPAHFEPVSGDKETRADPWSSALESLNVVLLKGGWNQSFINEHLLFPKGPFDDQVDAASSCYTRLMVKAVKKEVKSYSG